MALLTSLLFFPEKNFYEKPADYGFDSEDVRLESGAAKLFAWYLCAPKEKGAMLFLHGNAGNISHRLYKAKGWVDRGFSVLMLDYRGYGSSSGQIEKGEDVVADAQAGLNFLTEKKRMPVSKIILYGESLGTHPAIRLGMKEKCLAVVLEAPFTSFVDLAKVHYPMVPAALMNDFKFENLKNIEGLKSPLFILHGTQDEICPYEMSGDLLEAAPGPKSLFSIPGGGHNDLPNQAGEDYWEKPFEFVSKYLN